MLNNMNYTNTTDIRTANKERLAHFSNLQDNWNNNGAKAFPRELIDRVCGILDKIDIQPEIFPSATGVIDFEFSNPHKDFMSIDIGTGDICEVYIEMYDGQQKSEYIHNDVVTINEMIRRFY